MKIFKGKKRRIKFLLSTLIVINIVFNMLPIKTYAYPLYNKELCVSSSLERFRQVSELWNMTKTQMGVFQDMTTLTRMLLWTDYINNNVKDAFDYNGAEIDFVNNEVKNKVQSFNSLYDKAKTGTDYIEISLDKVSGKITHDYTQKAINTMFDYLIDYYNKLSTDLGKATDKKKFLQNNSAKIKMVNNMAQSLQQELDNIRNLTLGGDFDVHYSIDTAKANDLLSNEKYAEINEYAKKLVTEMVNREGIGLNKDADTLVKKLLMYHEGTDSKADLDSRNVSVNKAYMAMVASSAVYRPFESTIGDTDFIAALSALVDNNQEVVKVYNALKDLKKPLYAKQIDKKGTAVSVGFGNVKQTSSVEEKQGLATRITVSDFYKSVTDHKTNFELVTIKGKFNIGNNGQGRMVEDKEAKKIIENGPNAGKPVEDKKDDKKEEKKDDENKEGTVKDDGTYVEDGKIKKDSKDEKNAKDKKDSEFNTEGEITYLGQKITDQTKMSRPILSIVDDGRVSETTRLVVNNILQSHPKDLDKEDYDKRFLYVNPFGDILDDENTIIVPAACNPSFYNTAYNANMNYNPFTVAYMNSYPKTDFKGSTQVGKKDVGKYIMNFSDDEVKKYDGFKNTSNGPMVVNPSDEYIESQIFNDENSLSTQLSKKMMPIDTGLYNNNEQTINYFDFSAYQFEGGEHWWNVGQNISAGYDNMRMGTFGNGLLHPTYSKTANFGENSTLFPYTEKNDKKAIYIAKAMFEGMINATDVERNDFKLNTFSPRYDIDKITDIYLEAVRGKSDISSFQARVYQDYKEIAENDSTSFGKAIRNFAQIVTDHLGHSSGVIGFKNAYQDPVFGNLMDLVWRFAGFLAVGFSLYIVTLYTRRRFNFVYTIGAVLGTLVAFYLLLVVIPVYVPTILNALTGNTSDDIAYQSLFLEEEKFKNPTLNMNDDGRFADDAMSVTLYRFMPSDVDNFSRHYRDSGIDKVPVGKAKIIDVDSGVFYEKNTLKLNLHNYFCNYTLIGSSNDASGNYKGFYNYTLVKKVPSVVDYYMPHSMIMSSFVDKINNFSAVFQVPYDVIDYKKFTKPSFLVEAYCKSDLFFNPSDLKDFKKQMDLAGTPEVYDAVLTKFPNNVDFLGISDMLTKAKKDEIAKKSLWYQTLETNGYTSDPKKFNHLVEKTNSLTKAFIVDNLDILGYMSDETAVKVISLFATTQFDNIASYYGDQIYPHNLNYEELNTEETLLPILTSAREKYITADPKTADFVYQEFDAVGLLLYIPVVLLMFLITKIFTLAIPIMYIAFLILILLLITLDYDMKLAIKGYAKVFSIMLGCFAVFVWFTNLMHLANESIFSFFGMIIVYGIILAILCMLVGSVMTNYLDFGNTRINGTVKSLMSPLDKLFRKVTNMKSVNVNKMSISDKMKNRTRYEREQRDDVMGLGVVDHVMREKYGYKPTKSEQISRRLNRKKNRYRKAREVDDDHSHFNVPRF